MLVSTVHLVYESLTLTDVSGAVFTHAHVAQISSLCNFHYISEEIPSLMPFWLLITYISAADLAHADFWQT